MGIPQLGTTIPQLGTAAATLIRPTWYCWLLTGFYLYSVNLQGNVVPFLQAEFALSYRAVSLHSSAIAVGPVSEVGHQALGIRLIARLALILDL